MKGEIIRGLPVRSYQEVVLPNGERLMLADPLGERWSSCQLANHNVFRLDAAGNVVWQVTREEGPHVDWAARHAHAKAEDPAAEGYFDPFWSLGLDERGALSTEPAGIFRPGCKVYLTTRWWSYELDVETGVATCTGNQVK